MKEKYDLGGLGFGGLGRVTTTGIQFSISVMLFDYTRILPFVPKKRKNLFSRFVSTVSRLFRSEFDYKAFKVITE